MKCLTLLAALCFVCMVNKPARAQDPVTYQVFYDALAPYGKWLYDKTYGYVWTPSVANFRPYYTEGYWAMTNAGTTWISNYPWGWATFHYGRWVNNSLYHWVWVPGNKWASAWVVWRTSGDHAGWVPITPGTSITEAAATTYYVPADWWVFVKRKYLLKNNFRSYSEPSKSNNDLVRTNAINLNRHTGDKEEDTYMSGPNAADYAKSTGQKVTVFTMKQAAKPGKALVSGSTISMYMPFIDNGTKGLGQPKKYTDASQPIGKIASLSQGGTATGKAKASGKAKPTGKK